MTPELEIKNAVVTGCDIFIEDHGILTLSLNMTHSDGQSQSLGGYDVRTNLAEWVENIFRVTGVFNLKDLNKQPVRIKKEPRGYIISVGHFIADKWFTPSKDLKKKNK